jgi:hypothetical protein
MQLNHDLHLAYCTNIHRGETWAETFDSLKNYALAVREKVYPHAPFAIGLRLSQQAAVELSERKTVRAFQRWLAKNNCYVFTLNGFPFGKFHGAQIKEQVYRPDWTSPDRLNYTNLLFELLAQLLPEGIEGSVSTLPGSFKSFIQNDEQRNLIRKNIWACVEYISNVSQKTKRKLHLGLEPEPLCLLENSAETILFFEQLRAEHKNDSRLDEFLGVNYDCCHFAIEFEQPKIALAAFQNAGIKISKIHLSSALKADPLRRKTLIALKKFADDVYLHQVIACAANGTKKMTRDLPAALAEQWKLEMGKHKRYKKFFSEWRIHFHVPLHAPAVAPFANTNDHLLGVLDLLAENPNLCSHLEMETYTWEVLPPELKSRNVVEQLVAEYDWTLARLAERGLASR